ncbi:hypothetical protein T02_9696 [Trichinella nativa]|uniref:Uncharacterized protein n=1 Tax=Trichinella nativa TaxID=6335 RepID=A0A0V1L6Y7_9BILA|nr:hypothetical protein T02_9696 [Trichinella nativa]
MKISDSVLILMKLFIEYCNFPFAVRIYYYLILLLLLFSPAISKFTPLTLTWHAVLVDIS